MKCYAVSYGWNLFLKCLTITARSKDIKVPKVKMVMFFNVNFLANLMARIFCYFLRFDVIVVIGILKQKRREKYFFQTNHILVITS